jgi:cysteine desulfurase/selenocysteine lyase
VLDHRGIAVRAGHHCAMPLHDRLGVPASVRASFHCYSVPEDVDALVEGLHHARKVFG